MLFNLNWNFSQLRLVDVNKNKKWNVLIDVKIMNKCNFHSSLLKTKPLKYITHTACCLSYSLLLLLPKQQCTHTLTHSDMHVRMRQTAPTTKTTAAAKHLNQNDKVAYLSRVMRSEALQGMSRGKGGVAGRWAEDAHTTRQINMKAFFLVAVVFCLLMFVVRCVLLVAIVVVLQSQRACKIIC